MFKIADDGKKVCSVSVTCAGSQCRHETRAYILPCPGLQLPSNTPTAWMWWKRAQSISGRSEVVLQLGDAQGNSGFDAGASVSAVRLASQFSSSTARLSGLTPNVGCSPRC